MPAFSLDLSDIKGFENLPLGEYEGEIKEMKYQPARQEGKAGQIKTTYQVIDGEFESRIQSEWLSLSDKASGRLKKWFANFDLGDAKLEFDEDTLDMIEPDLVGTRVIFEVYKERDTRVADEEDDKAYQIKTRLVTVPGTEKKSSGSSSRTVSKAPSRTLR